MKIVPDVIRNKFTCYIKVGHSFHGGHKEFKWWSCDKYTPPCKQTETNETTFGTKDVQIP